jgi:hypothetical protein
LSVPATVKALIWKGSLDAGTSNSLTPVGEGELRARRIASALHIALVTIDLSAAATTLEAGQLYSYNLRFSFDGGHTSDLQVERLLEDELAGSRLPSVNASAPLHKALGFQKDKLPTFLVPPSTLATTSPSTPAAGLRIAHASCRRPGAGSFDALAGLAALVLDPDRRPHQLYLTGDQIYADDIATPLLPVVAGLGDEIAGGAQPLPGFPPDRRQGGSGNTPVTSPGLPGTLANLPAMRRKWLLWELAGFTGSDVENHLITFPEFAAHHLLAWSPRAWRAVATFQDVFKAPGVPSGAAAPAAGIAPWLNQPWFCFDGADPSQPEATLKQGWGKAAANKSGFDGFNVSAHHVARYAGATPLVAQALANTPTYMMFDDHEIADDWNLNGLWFAKVYSRPWGRFVIRNGLMAFAVMQGWGNDPSKFATGQPGAKLLDAITAAVAIGSGPSAATIAAVDVLLGFDQPTTAIPKRVEWFFSTGTDDYKAVVLDTRTHRDLSTTTLDAPNLVANLDEQLPARPNTATQKALIVVSPAPVFGPAVIEQIGQPLAQLAQDAAANHTAGEIPGFSPGDADDPQRRAGCGSRVERGAEKYDREGWSANEKGFETLVARLAEYQSVVLLSGDVHYACTLTLDYWSKGKEEKPSRLIQCVSSPAKNVFRAVVDQIIRQAGNLQRAEEVPIERLAWKKISATDLVPAGARLSLARKARLRREPALVPSTRWPAGTTLPASAAKAPDWRWRVKPIIDTTTNLPAALRPAPIEAGNDARPDDERLTRIAATHRRRLTEAKPLLRRLVFSPNFGTVQFAASGTKVNVTHSIYTSTEPSLALDTGPLPPGVLPLQDMTFGPHTVHKAELSTPGGTDPPTIQTVA